jgi:hypothetical protein
MEGSKVITGEGITLEHLNHEFAHHLGYFYSINIK